jgi:probable LLM family oxidoreductase
MRPIDPLDLQFGSKSGLTLAFELGLDTFGEVTFDEDGSLVPQPRVIRIVLEEAALADDLGLDFFAVGEHHRPDLAISSPEVVLAAIAARTSRIHLGSAVTILSTDDPIRVYERFATLDAISSGRAEIILGRGSFTESFALFGYQLEDYDLLFEEKLQLFAELLKEGPVTWSGQTRPPLNGQRAYPTTESGSLKTWIGVGGTPQSVIRAAKYGFPLVVAVIGGQPMRFAPLIELYRRALQEFGQPARPVAAHSPGHIAESDEQAREELWPHYQAFYTKIGGERGWPPTTRAQFDAGTGPDGALFVGSPETVARKIVMVARGLGLSRFDLKYSMGTLPHSKLMRSIELFGTRVAPLVRGELAKTPEPDVAASA